MWFSTKWLLDFSCSIVSSVEIQYYFFRLLKVQHTSFLIGLLGLYTGFGKIYIRANICKIYASKMPWNYFLLLNWQTPCLKFKSKLMTGFSLKLFPTNPPNLGKVFKKQDRGISSKLKLLVYIKRLTKYLYIYWDS